MKLRRRMATQQ